MIAAPAAQAATTTGSKTKYPLVLVHGFIGFDNILGIQYFYNIPNSLRKDGATVYVASVNPSQTTEFRGEELVRQLQQWAAADGTFDKVATGGLQLIGWLTGNGTYKQADLLTALGALSAPGAAVFNAKFPAGAPTSDCGQGPEVASVNGNSIRWYSISGTAVKTNGWDISDAILAYTGDYFKGEPNDGLVSQRSSHWGKVIKDNYHWNHLDEVNQVLGTIGKGDPDPVAFYKQQASRLKALAL